MLHKTQFALSLSSKRHVHVNMASTSPYIDPSIELCRSNDGPLINMTFAVKDLFDIKGTRTGFGHPLWLETHGPAAATAPVVQQLLHAGASVRGKTALDELAYSLNGENYHYGTPSNPSAPGRIPGGSSSGSASACSAGDCDFAVGSDTGGSVRVPASYCGLYGIRPTWGRISLEGARPLAPSFDTVGIFSRSPQVMSAAMGVLLKPSKHQFPPTQLKRFLLARDAFALAEGDTVEALLSALKSNSPTIRVSEEIDLALGLESQNLGSLPLWFDAFRVIQAGEIWQEHGDWVSKNKPIFGPGIKERFEMASKISDEDKHICAKKREVISAHVSNLLANDAVLIIPTAPGPAPLLNTPPASLDRWRASLLSLTCIAGLTRLPQITIPIAKVGGLPIGLSFIGPMGSDEELIQLSLQTIICSDTIK